MLTRNEKMLIADALNGTYLEDNPPQYMAVMCGKDGPVADAAIIGIDSEGAVTLTGSIVCSGLELEIYDAIRLNGLDDKWEVNGADLLHKIRAMSRANKEKLIRLVAELWRRNDENFRRDLVALEV